MKIFLVLAAYAAAGIQGELIYLKKLDISNVEVFLGLQMSPELASEMQRNPLMNNTFFVKSMAGGIEDDGESEEGTAGKSTDSLVFTHLTIKL